MGVIRAGRVAKKAASEPAAGNVTVCLYPLLFPSRFSATEPSVPCPSLSTSRSKASGSVPLPWRTDTARYVESFVRWEIVTSQYSRRYTFYAIRSYILVLGEEDLLELPCSGIDGYGFKIAHHGARIRSPRRIVRRIAVGHGSATVTEQKSCRRIPRNLRKTLVRKRS